MALGIKMRETVVSQTWCAFQLLYGYETSCDLKSLSRDVIMHVLFPAVFIVWQLWKFPLTDSWRANCADTCPEIRLQTTTSVAIVAIDGVF